MNRTLTSLITMGVGAAAYHLSRNTNMMNNRSMKKMRKRVMKMF
ncbi:MULTISPECIES: YrzQ family protein [Metabacillus]|uniref:YrzQ family protein n=1 Tax=Metabacillus endolithicus TaxID=1535204 RepID=A0ABW5BW74_9BACI|nr:MULTISPECIES: YrzQ family protein [Metabacillus]MCM3161885.1 YrzQ family protein [Metabacillus litoralis]MCM3413066.1 YrzQ family protein [Metabacillus litoralis]UGB29620.1 YrzQ family protein [Metabacillus sp. B2-18]UHA62388.1 YrzQ family protein [Metabacillus litoralis]UPG64638.1 YrzQ family protein [Metabacillus endolithicus]